MTTDPATLAMMTVEGDEIELDLTYAEALDELDGILAELEATTVDVDVLAERVARGAVLVRYCRQRLQVVRTDVEEVVETMLDDPANGSAPTAEASAG